MMGLSFTIISALIIGGLIAVGVFVAVWLEDRKQYKEFGRHWSKHKYE